MAVDRIRLMRFNGRQKPTDTKIFMLILYIIHVIVSKVHMIHRQMFSKGSWRVLAVQGIRPVGSGSSGWKLGSLSGLIAHHGLWYTENVQF